MSVNKLPGLVAICIFNGLAALLIAGMFGFSAHGISALITWGVILTLVLMAFGLYLRINFVRISAIIFYVFLLVSDITFAILPYTKFSKGVEPPPINLFSFIGTAITIIIIWYLLRPVVRDSFAKKIEG